MSKTIIWIDPKINNSENSYYQSILNENVNFAKKYYFKTIKEGIDQLKYISFKPTIIITSGRFYTLLIEELKKNICSIKVIPEIIIFTSNIEKYKKKNGELINEDFYNYGQIYDDFILLNEHLIEKYKDNNENILEINTNHNFINNIENDNDNNNDIEKRLSFDIINDLKNVILPIFFQTLRTESNFINQKIFYNKIYKNYKNVKDITNLLLPILHFPTIPMELLSKYYIRLYTFKTNFYRDMNVKLMENKGKEYIPFIQCLYDGINLKSFEPYSEGKLYRGSCIKKIELENIQKALLEKNEEYPKVIISSRAFLSFSTNEEVAFDFIRYNKKDSYPVLYEIQKPNKMDIEFCTNANIQKLSDFFSESEILFFPFSSFEIVKIEKTNNKNGKKIYKIDLEYLGKYKFKIKMKYIHQPFFLFIENHTQYYKNINQELDNENNNEESENNNNNELIENEKEEEKPKIEKENNNYNNDDLNLINIPLIKKKNRYMDYF